MLELLHLTCTTASAQQLPILDSLVPATRVRNNCQHSQPSSIAQQPRSPSPLPPASPPSSFCLSSDSSNSEACAYTQPKGNFTMSTPAAVEPTSAKAPVLTAGDISPGVMMDFKNAALDFFISKSVPDDKQVTMIIPGIKDLHICDWIATKHARIVALPFAEFMTEMRFNYLPQDWEDQVHNDILMSTLTTSKMSFWNWSQHLLKLNCLLHGTSSAFDNATLRNHLEVHLDNELKARVQHNNIHKDKKFKTWVGAVCLLNEVCAVKNKRQHEMIEETLHHQSKHQKTNNDSSCNSSHHGNSTQSNTTSTSSSYICLPPLTNAEHTLLNENDGCTKCRKFFAGH